MAVITVSSEAGENSDTPSVQAANLRSFVRARLETETACVLRFWAPGHSVNSSPSNIEATSCFETVPPIFVSNDDPHFAILPCGGQVHPHQCTETRTIHVVHIG